MPKFVFAVIIYTLRDKVKFFCVGIGNGSRRSIECGSGSETLAVSFVEYVFLVKESDDDIQVVTKENPKDDLMGLPVEPTGLYPDIY